MTARLPPARFAELGPINWILCKVLSAGAGVPEAHLFTALGRQRTLFRSWLMFSARLMPGGTLERQETELVILRIAHLRGCEYERDHHVRMGRRVGIGEELLRRIEEGPKSAGLLPKQRALLSAVDELVLTKDLSERCWDELQQHYSGAQLVELCLLVGQYEMLATTIKALRIERDF